MAGRTRTLRLLVFVAAFAWAATGVAAVTRINGAGATFPYPIYSKWFAEYNRLHPDLQINYQPIGSGGGIRQLTNRTVDFGATDSPMTARQMLAASEAILHVPTVVGAVVPIYNLPGVTSELAFSGPLLADIFLGRITKWNDRAIAALNSGVALPAMDITVAHRADGAGTTYIWVDYLSKVSPEFQARVGVNTSVRWPTGVGGRGNEGVAGLVKLVPGSIGYVELIYARQNRMPYASVRNAAGETVKASVESVAAAAAEAVGRLSADFRVSITNASGKGAYPIASFSWLLLNENAPDRAKSKAMVDFTRWALTEGQPFAAELGYAPLPDAVVRLALAALARIER